MKKNRFMAILAALLILALLPGAALAEHVSLAYSGGALYLRKGPGTEYRSLGTVQHGDYIDVLSHGSVWSKVETDDGRIGYIKNLYIEGGDTNYASGIEYYDSHYSAYVTATVNFRAGASTSTASMGTLTKGTKVTVLGENGGFYLVRNSAGTQGFVSKSYVSRTKPSGSGSSTGSAKTKTVTASAVNMRAGGGLSYSVIKVLPRGTVVTVVATGNYWTRVNYKGTLGWIRNTYLK